MDKKYKAKIKKKMRQAYEDGKHPDTIRIDIIHNWSLQWNKETEKLLNQVVKAVNKDKKVNGKRYHKMGSWIQA